MKTVTVRDLRDRGDEIVARVIAGESMTITRSGTPVAEIRPVAKRALDREALLERWRHLPPIDLAEFQADVDAVVDPSL